MVEKIQKVVTEYEQPHMWKITNLFEHTNVKISYKCSNTVAQLTKPASGHNKSGVSCLTCKTCNLLYVGQPSQTLRPASKSTSES